MPFDVSISLGLRPVMVTDFCVADPAYEPPESGNVTMVDRLPGARKLLVRDERSAPSAWLGERWAAAQRARREAVWNALPDDVLEYLQEHSVLVTNPDLKFLARIASESGARSPAEINAAIRLLGGISEDGFARKETVRQHLLVLLSARQPAIRTAAAEAIWQARDRVAVPALRAALMREEHPHARLTLQHVLRVLS